MHNTIIKPSILAERSYTAGLKVNGTVVTTQKGKSGEIDTSRWKNIKKLVKSSYGLLGLKTDGTVVYTSTDNRYPQRHNLSSWKDIISVTAKSAFIGLKSDGTVLVDFPDTLIKGEDEWGRYDEKWVSSKERLIELEKVTEWKGIISICDNSHSVFGLKSDGTVCSTGGYDTSEWKDIISLVAGSNHIIGLTKDGKVVAVPNRVGNKYGECDTSTWENISSIYSGGSHTIGIRKDGSVVATGYNRDGQCEVSSWRDIVSISATFYSTTALKSDGTIVEVGRNPVDRLSETSLKEFVISDWQNIISISPGDSFRVGLKADGTFVAYGYNGQNQCEVSNWNLGSALNTQNINKITPLKKLNPIPIVNSPKIEVAGTSHIPNIKSLGLEVGDKLNLVREPYNSYDSNAIRLDDFMGRKVGYIPKSDNSGYARILNSGQALYAKVVELESWLNGLGVHVEIIGISDFVLANAEIVECPECFEIRKYEFDNQKECVCHLILENNCPNPKCNVAFGIIGVGGCYCHDKCSDCGSYDCNGMCGDTCRGYLNYDSDGNRIDDVCDCKSCETEREYMYEEL